MGLDLTLLPFDADGEISFSHTVLMCSRDYDLFDWIKTLPALDVPSSFTSYVSRDDDYEESHYGLTVETPYGEPVKYTNVKELLNTPSHISTVFSVKNLAIWAYLNRLERDTKVALFWH